MTCVNCGNEGAHAMRFWKGGCSCNECGGFTPKGTPDVFFQRPYLDPNLAHPARPHEKDGVWVESRQHKARLMAEQGLREGGDTRHGSRNFDRRLASGDSAQRH